MADFLSMHGYAAYVWTAYAVFAMTLLADALAPALARKRALRELRARMQREARKTSAKAVPPQAEGAA
jgi:heme exporter protein D